jgi:hypothetical protein
MSDDNEDFPTNEDNGEAAFYHFCHDLKHYLKSGTWGPRIWNSLDKEEQDIVANLVLLDAIGVKDIADWKPENVSRV